MKYLIAFAALTALLAPVSAWSASDAATAKGALIDIASSSQCANYSWKDRGRAPRSYVAGVALVFARAICHPERADVKIMSAAPDAVLRPNDALVRYQEVFSKAGMSNVKSGPETLRHAYTLLLGLGMMESSGKYCEGRDVSQCFAKPESAEAGLFQTSYGAHTHSSALDVLFKSYSNDPKPCLLDAFQGTIQCKIRKSHNASCPLATSDIAGTGVGADWQRLTKSCPAFATEYGAVVLRTNGGIHGEFNPIRKLQAEVRPECDSMFHKVQEFVGDHPELCSGL